MSTEPPKKPDWARRLAPATSPEQRERLLGSLSPAMRKAVEAWARRSARKPA